MTDNPLFSKLDHVGLIVRDLDKAVEHLQSMGIGPFKPFQKVVRYDTELYGKPVDPDDIKLGIRMADTGGGLRIELIQPLGGGPWREFVETKGGGMHHLAFAV
ncbi:MAG: VOC family protein, partial [Chloroflexota bacterium]